ncbi:MAG: TMEM43 family protein [Spirochaetes bacterium]|jgi:hypothetical protein|nr:TMEM43 family protein [Spirochaetota bacterium]
MGDNEDNGMSETTVEEQGPLSQIGSSIKNVFAGIICFILSFVVLWCGATRVEWAKVFKKAVPIEKAKEGEPSYLTGIATAEEIGDQHLAKGKYLRIEKTPEVYAYVENKESKSDTKRKGISRTKETTTTTTYSYELKWTNSPQKVSDFNQKFWEKYANSNNINPRIANPVMDEKSETTNAKNCTVGGYSVDLSSAKFYSGGKSQDTLYVKGNKNAPKLGDKRINYVVYPSGQQYTFAGTASGKKISAYEYSDKESQLAAAQGEFKDLLKQLKSSDKLSGMLYFFGGFILMAIGLNMMAGPITTLLEFIPFLGGLGAGLIRVVLTIAALILATVFYWLIKLWWLWLILVAVAVIAVILVKKKGAKTATA